MLNIEIFLIGNGAVYYASTEPLCADDAYAAALDAISPTRRARAERYRDRERAAQCVAAELLLRHALRELGFADEPVFSREKGKPHLLNAPHIDFNLSHTAGLAVCAVSATCDVGADVERVRRTNIKVAERYFGADERRRIELLPQSERDGAFFELWTRYEAAFKCGGSSMFTLTRRIGEYVLTYCERAREYVDSAGDLR
ncbi:MAG: 4'-phosphopantetheinyl transferase superfamily protein [Oscillospiraceae bacterium]|jgi:4'-phosphopantetheinyl transferase|nr:4'-phosphopantetheinyl transferase superfamily protein [Oscillospiraceae bacterium]